MRDQKKYKVNRHNIAFAMLCVSLLFYPQDKGFTQEKVIKPEVKISPYVKAANILQDSIIDKRQDRDNELYSTIALLKKKIKERPVKYVLRKQVTVHDTVYVAMEMIDKNPPAEDYIEADSVMEAHDFVPCPPAKKPNLFQRIFKHKKSKQ